MSVKREEGHKLLARVGKTRLRPGGKEATDWLLEKSGIDKDSKVLEVACNMGTNTVEMAQNYGCSIIGLDKDEDAFKQAKENVEKNGLSDSIELVHGDATDLPFEDGKFDIVVNEAMLTMLPNEMKEKAIREYKRVLKDGGRLITHDVCLVEEDRELVQELKRVINVPAEPLTEDGWKKLFEDAGFKNIEVKTGRMTLMSEEGMLKDEGKERMIEIMERVMNDPNVEQFVEMKEFFTENKDKLLYIAVKSKK